MRKSICYSLLGAGGLILSLLSAPTLAGITVSVQPPSTTVNPGQTFSVNIRVSGLDSVTPPEIVRAYDLLLGYDQTLLTAIDVVFGNYLGGNLPSGSSQSEDLAFDLTSVSYTGSYTRAVEFSELSNLCGYASEAPCTEPLYNGGPYLSDIQPDTFDLVTIFFQAKSTFQQGTTTLALIDDSSMSSFEGFDMKGNSRTTPLDVTLENGQVTAEVPEPGTLSLLLGAGLLGMGRSAVRRRQNTAGLLGQ